MADAPRAARKRKRRAEASNGTSSAADAGGAEWIAIRRILPLKPPSTHHARTLDVPAGPAEPTNHAVELPLAHQAKRQKKKTKKKKSQKEPGATSDTDSSAQAHESRRCKLSKVQHQGTRLAKSSSSGKLSVPTPQGLGNLPHQHHGKLPKRCGLSAVPPPTRLAPTGGAEAAGGARSQEARHLKHTFATDAGDHCETPLQAYKDIDPLLQAIARSLGKPKEKLRILDPFFCAGAMVAHLKSLGYPRVVNENRDWYQTLREGAVPEHDVLLTNPPYSGGHVRKLLEYVSGSSKPAILLVPAYVHKEPYYEAAVRQSQPPPMFLYPLMRYAYMSPAGLRGGRPIPVTPFESIWHLHLGALTKTVRAKWDVQSAKLSRCTLYHNRTALMTRNTGRQIARTEGRPNPKARKRARKKILAQRQRQPDAP